MMLQHDDACSMMLLMMQQHDELHPSATAASWQCGSAAAAAASRQQQQHRGSVGRPVGVRTVTFLMSSSGLFGLCRSQGVAERWLSLAQNALGEIAMAAWRQRGRAARGRSSWEPTYVYVLFGERCL